MKCICSTYFLKEDTSPSNPYDFCKTQNETFSRMFMVLDISKNIIKSS